MPLLCRLRSPRRIAMLGMLAALVVAAGVLSTIASAPEARAAAGGSSLAAGETLRPGEFLTSRSGLYRLTMQTDGNLVLAAVGCPQGTPDCLYAHWALGTTGQPGNRLTMQRDGNLVMYSSTGRAVWATRTTGTGSTNVLKLQDDTNLVVYSGTRAVWFTGKIGTYAHVTGRQVGDLRSPNGRYTFATPGNGMHVWDGGVPTWGLNCLNDPRVDCNSLKGQLVLQTDGNLVWYHPGRTGGRVAVWSSRTNGTGPTTNLHMQNDGNLVLYDLWHRPLWSSKGGLVRR